MKTKRAEKKEQLWCPYCEYELVSSQLQYCQSCRVEIFKCPECGEVTPRTNKICPHCGAEMKPKETH